MSLDAWQTVETDAIGNGMLLIFGVVIAGFLRGSGRRLSAAIREHFKKQKEIAANQQQILDALDPRSPGGLGEVDLPLREPGDDQRSDRNV